MDIKVKTFTIRAPLAYAKKTDGGSLDEGFIASGDVCHNRRSPPLIPVRPHGSRRAGAEAVTARGMAAPWGGGRGQARHLGLGPGDLALEGLAADLVEEVLRRVVDALGGGTGEGGDGVGKGRAFGPLPAHPLPRGGGQAFA